ncbi:SDR family NAD(P)-dependent oxidoreductase [Sphingobium sp. 15-1]|uniref:SDR family NAD(P)-dependent oxidoreductase n=1 Tax=Sphingobium sp. 15-1 TaxID=2729616 RepID=UPI00159CC3B4
MIDLTGKSVIITGAASGIGRATAILAASLGANLTLGDRTEEAGASVVDEIEAAGGTAQFVRCDVAQEDDVEALVCRCGVPVRTAGRRAQQRRPPQCRQRSP